MNKLAQINIGDEFLPQLGHGASGNTFKSLTGIGSLVSLFLNVAFVIAGLILLVFFIMGGIGMIASAGKSDPKAAEQAKATMTSAVIGFVIVFAAYWIVQLVGTFTGVKLF